MNCRSEDRQETSKDRYVAKTNLQIGSMKDNYGFSSSKKDINSWVGANRYPQNLGSTST